MGFICQAKKVQQHEDSRDDITGKAKTGLAHEIAGIHGDGHGKEAEVPKGSLIKQGKPQSQKAKWQGKHHDRVSVLQHIHQ
jgi:hypothetical protein